LGELVTATHEDPLVTMEQVTDVRDVGLEIEPDRLEHFILLEPAQLQTEHSVLRAFGQQPSDEAREIIGLDAELVVPELVGHAIRPLEVLRRKSRAVPCEKIAQQVAPSPYGERDREAEGVIGTERGCHRVPIWFVVTNADKAHVERSAAIRLLALTWGGWPRGPPLGAELPRDPCGG
jgi:hypothetical protein